MTANLTTRLRLFGSTSMNDDGVLTEFQTNPLTADAADEIDRLRAERRDLLYRAELLADAVRAYLDSDFEATSKAFTALSRWEHRPGNCECCAHLHAEARRG